MESEHINTEKDNFFGEWVRSKISQLSHFWRWRMEKCWSRLELIKFNFLTSNWDSSMSFITLLQFSHDISCKLSTHDDDSLLALQHFLENQKSHLSRSFIFRTRRTSRNFSRDSNVQNKLARDAFVRSANKLFTIVKTNFSFRFVFISGAF